MMRFACTLCAERQQTRIRGRLFFRFRMSNGPATVGDLVLNLLLTQHMGYSRLQQSTHLIMMVNRMNPRQNSPSLTMSEK